MVKFGLKKREEKKKEKKAHEDDVVPLFPLSFDFPKKR